MFKFIQKSVFDPNTWTLNWVPLMGTFDVHYVNCPICGWNNSYTRDSRGSCFPGTLCERQKGVQVKRFHRSTATSQGSIVFNIRTFRVHQIEADKEGAGCQVIGASIRPTWTGDGKNEKLYHQAKCAAIFDIHPRKIPWTVFQTSS